MIRSTACRLLLVAGLAAALPAFAEDPISTDRPDFVESSATVGRHVQLETSVAASADAGSPLERSTPTLLRVGLGDAWELRFETEGRVTAVGQSDWSDLGIGVKHHLQDRDGMPSMAWIAGAELPTGVGADHRGVRPSLEFVAEWEFAHDIGVGVMPGIAYERGDGDDGLAGLFAVVVGKSFADGRARVFGEVAAQRIPMHGNGGPETTFDAGASWRFGDSTQVDMAFSYGLSDAAVDRAWTVGLSQRW
ncbi:transporter [Cognatilysobacter terrigena]|uniref:transporter n=1 Tax=Cognatilysobacter terrigena TaxID=2488749 RepID=UPI0010605773|nr:transporter [Lysobacter terrigena]